MELLCVYGAFMDVCDVCIDMFDEVYWYVRCNIDMFNVCIDTFDLFIDMFDLWIDMFNMFIITFNVFGTRKTAAQTASYTNIYTQTMKSHAQIYAAKVNTHAHLIHDSIMPSAEAVN
jgi:hypothetical protein